MASAPLPKDPAAASGTCREDHASVLGFQLGQARMEPRLSDLSDARGFSTLLQPQVVLEDVHSDPLTSDPPSVGQFLGHLVYSCITSCHAVSASSERRPQVPKPAQPSP